MVLLSFKSALINWFNTLFIVYRELMFPKYLYRVFNSLLWDKKNPFIFWSDSLKALALSELCQNIQVILCCHMYSSSYSVQNIFNGILCALWNWRMVFQVTALSSWLWDHSHLLWLHFSFCPFLSVFLFSNFIQI